MTSKERVHAALERKPVDRVPIFMWFHPQTTRHLATVLEIPSSFVGEAMGNDIRQTWVNNNYAMEGIVHEREGEGHTDAWGIRWKKIGHFNQIAEFPLEDASREKVLSYQFPSYHQEELLSQMLPLLEDPSDWFVGCDVSPCVFEMYFRLRGMSNALTDMATDEELAREMFKRCADFSIALAKQACKRFPLDWLWSGDDVAGQDALMMSPEMWREQIKPQLQRVFDVGNAANLWVAHHCCGSLRPIIPDLIEMGLNVLNPIQCNCPGMDPLALKKEFGHDLAFMGGVDTVDLLPAGTVEQIRRSTAQLLEGMTADGGGYILAASHTIPPETPDENIFALFAEAGVSKEEIYDRAAKIRAHRA
ncbi:MAG: uroporphyrinogen decarboxylase family protein [Bacteroidota bacterium]|jgi:uroporphyrinogen decarboxylase